jgi:opacity protein-like surface antigen
MRRILFAALVMLACDLVILAQSSNQDRYNRIDVFAGFSANDYFNYIEFPASIPNLNFSPFLTSTAGGKGVQTSVTGYLTKYFGITGDFSVYFDNIEAPLTIKVCQPAGQCTIGAQQDTRATRTAFYFMAGPEVRGRNRTRFTPFARALFGGVASNASFSTRGTALIHSDSDTRSAFSMNFGGGLDVRVSERFAIRGTADYTGIFLRDLGDTDSGGGSLHNHLRLAIGVVIRFH